MRCKKHPTDLSSGVGVCSSCLRERLFALIAAQAQAHQLAQLARAQSLAAAPEDRRKSDPHPPPLLFPRSVSPYVSRRKSDHTAAARNSHHHQDQLFYSTPQVGPNYNTTGSFKKKKTKFSLFSNLFRSRSEKLAPASDPRISSRNPCETSASFPSWFPNILPGRRKKQSRLFSLEETIVRGGRPCQISDRGMSPDNDFDLDAECDDRSPSASGYSSESSQGWRRSPMTAPTSVRRGRQGHGRNVSGLAFCLSPLVRASPSRQWNQKRMPPDMGITGEIRVPVKPHLSTAASFCSNRSRKLVDFGKVNHNR